MRGILFASFGSTHESARKNALDALALDLKDRFGLDQVFQAYTSGMIRRALSKRGIEILDVEGALRDMASKGIDEVLVSVGHVLPGEEYDKVIAAVDACRSLFTKIELAKPLMNGSSDIADLALMLEERFAKTDDHAVLFMGHGTEQFANVAYAALDYQLSLHERPDMIIATVEAFPSLDEAMLGLKKLGANHVTLAPLMLVAGEHAKNDMAGDDEDSWANVLKRAGYEVKCDITGLGEIPQVRELYISHAKKAANLLGW